MVNGKDVSTLKFSLIDYALLVNVYTNYLYSYKVG